MFNYENYLNAKLQEIKYDLELEDLEIKVCSEQAFGRLDMLTPKTVYVVIKFLSSDITYEGKTTPIQITALSEQNKQNDIQLLLAKFAEEHNWEGIHDGTTFIKQQYSTPVVLSNFNEVGSGWRSLIYLSGNLYVLENVLEINNFKLGNIDIKPLSFSFAYSMAGNTQQLSTENISKTVKSASSVSFAITLPFFSTGMATILNIMKGDGTGNENINIKFSIGDTNFEYDTKLVSSTITYAPNRVPSIQIGLQV